MMSRPMLAVALVSTAITSCAWSALAAPALTEASVDGAAFSPLPDKPETRASPEVVKVEVLLDRDRFSVGPIDGVAGDNFRDAVTAYQKQMRLDPTGRLDQATWSRLTASGALAPLTRYAITATDARGPFVKHIPAKFEAQSRLKRLGYQDIREELSERFHMSQTLLAALNPGSRFRVGERIAVANVDLAGPADTAARVVVDKRGHDVEALAADGHLLAFYPASIGSADKPAPTGNFTIRRVDHNPDYTYDPKYHFKGVNAKQPFTIAPGPNNPVGLVWIDLGGDGYGIHGTPDPAAVGKTQSHGCIRLTNWDALNLAAMVDHGTPVSFGDVPGSSGPVTPQPATEPVAVAPPQAGVPGTAAPVPNNPALTEAAKRAP